MPYKALRQLWTSDEEHGTAFATGRTEPTPETMKKNTSQLTLGAALLGSMLFLACTGSPEQTESTMQEKAVDAQSAKTEVAGQVVFEAERDALKGTLLGLQGELDVKLKEVDEALAKTGLQEDARKAAEALRAELEGKRRLAAERLNELGEAVQASWPNVKTKADTAVAQLERSLATARQGAGTGATEEQQANDGH